MHGVCEARRSGRPSLLVLNLYMVHPVNSGAKVVIFNRLRALSQAFRVTFCCLEESPADRAGAAALQPWCDVVLAQGREEQTADLPQRREQPCASAFAAKLDAWYDSAELRYILTQRFDVVELHSSCWFRQEFTAVTGLKVLVAHNREVDYYRDQARVVRQGQGGVAGRRAARDAALVARQERQAIAASDAVVSLAPLTPEDASAWFGSRPVLHNWGGVDLASYRDVREGMAAVASASGPVLVCVAAFFVEAAAEAAWRFVQEALPEILRVYPGTRLRLVGDHRQHPRLVALSAHPSVDVTGLVSDVRPHLAVADVVVVPIMHGSGVRYKLMEALAVGAPVVATEKAAEGLGLTTGQDAVLVETVRQMGPAVVALLERPELRHEMSTRAQVTATERFDHVAEHAALGRWYYEQLIARGASPAQITPS